MFGKISLAFALIFLMNSCSSPSIPQNCAVCSPENIKSWHQYFQKQTLIFEHYLRNEQNLKIWKGNFHSDFQNEQLILFHDLKNERCLFWCYEHQNQFVFEKLPILADELSIKDLDNDSISEILVKNSVFETDLVKNTFQIISLRNKKPIIWYEKEGFEYDFYYFSGKDSLIFSVQDTIFLNEIQFFQDLNQDNRLEMITLNLAKVVKVPMIFKPVPKLEGSYADQRGKNDLIFGKQHEFVYDSCVWILNDSHYQIQNKVRRDGKDFETWLYKTNYGAVYKK